jgi:hypothetical protein
MELAMMFGELIQRVFPMSSEISENFDQYFIGVVFVR